MFNLGSINIYSNTTLTNTIKISLLLGLSIAIIFKASFTNLLVPLINLIPFLIS